jgi:hypothetical protein
MQALISSLWIIIETISLILGSAAFIGLVLGPLFFFMVRGQGLFPDDPAVDADTATPP